MQCLKSCGPGMICLREPHEGPCVETFEVYKCIVDGRDRLTQSADTFCERCAGVPLKALVPRELPCGARSGYFVVALCASCASQATEPHAPARPSLLTDQAALAAIRDAIQETIGPWITVGSDIPLAVATALDELERTRK
jgi:hypothetical protein